ncbi:unnamed protein product [Rhizophagus irregularis]|uniref:Schlafen group 3-like DNA/RNA helicase domain-containing protein n=1 Tax=Rhizophagus irregularis TaxID=588596 RepID=A0A915YQF1_9GLOM|nr:unnamed protein product [Rhizophagus irregularis]CAB5313122.1 unnamed protein product [Rhizophagus irregularis]
MLLLFCTSRMQSKKKSKMPNLMIVGISWEELTEQCRKIPSILIVDEAHLIYGKDKEASNKESADTKESADQFWATVNLQKYHL